MSEMQNRPEVNDSKNPFIKVYKWFHNYWYFYKIPILFISVAVLIIVGILVSVFTKDKVDYSLAFVSLLNIEENDIETIKSNFNEYLPDINNDKEVKTDLTRIIVDYNNTDEFSYAAYQAITSMQLLDQVVFFIADEYCANYLIRTLAAEPLSVLGITGGVNDYMIDITDSPLLKNTAIATYTSYYLLVKTESATDMNNPEYAARRESIKPLLNEVLP